MMRIAAALALFLSACSSRGDRFVAPEPAPPPAPTASSEHVGEAPDRIATLTGRLAAHPRLYPVWAQLGEAYLERARRTHDPEAVAKSEEALATSLSIQENFEALTLMTALANFRHRFPDALAFGERAARALPTDTAVLSMRVEALASLGKIAEAEALLRSAGDASRDFYLMASRARLEAEGGRVDEAIEAFRRAAGLAEAQKAPAFQAWAHLRIAELLLDSGRHEHAAPELAVARGLAPGTRDLAVHEAELLAARGRARESIERFDSLLAQGEDPYLHADMVPLLIGMGDLAGARRHFEAAEKGFLAPISRGEVYTLEALAKLHIAEGSRPDKALEYARRNLDHKQDAGARETFERATKAAR